MASTRTRDVGLPGKALCGAGVSRPRARARSRASRRRWAPSLSYRCRMCVRTVFTDTYGTEVVLGAWVGTGAPPVAVGTRVALGGRNVSSLVVQTSRPTRIESYADATGPIADIA